MNPVKASLRYPQVTLVLTLAAVSLGVWSLLEMPRREDPKITIRAGLVIAAYPGATAEQVEKQVTEKIEERLFRFEEVRKDKTFSTSRPGLAVIHVELEDHVKQPDIFWSKLRHNLLELRQTSLPQGVRGPVVDDSFGDTAALLIAIHGENYGYRQLKDYATRIEEELRAYRAVARLQRFGEQKEEILITSSMDRLAQYNFSPRNVIGALQGRNVIQFAGSVKTGGEEAPMKTSGLFETEEQIRRVMVDMSPTGQPVYIGDVAEVTRRYKDPTQICRFNGERAVLLSVEMQEGYNIVDFGKVLRARMERIKEQLPPDLKIDLVADQPAVVERRIRQFLREFGIAIASVILVTVLLLPLRVAVIASLAIPVTVASTFALLNAARVELHQVSISALIVVLGMVVDDAIVIADNYVELLDRKVPIAEAAERCASELTVPVLAATATIVFAFLPMLRITGNVGEFIQALPISVAISLSVSFVVAMLLTPLLCRFFIHKGLHADQEADSRRGFRLLDRLQSAYAAAIRLAMRHKKATAVLGLAAFLAGIGLQRLLPQRFFPAAERPQFVIDIWMQEGTRLEATDAAVRRIEAHLAADPLVRDYTSFVGRSAPRFYYNVSPEFPAANYAQLLVNTRDTDATPALVYRLRRELAPLFPEARVIVKELEQGKVIPAPIEVRISGPELSQLQRTAQHVERALRQAGGADFIFPNWHEDAYALAVDLKHDVAGRLGLSTAGVSLQLGGGFSGLPVTTFWEGDRDVDVVLRLEEEKRRDFDDVAGMYVVSSLTGARVPLRAVAELHPEWQPSRIVRRNGIRTLTVLALPGEGQLASSLLGRAAPLIAAIPVPEGYRISYGGERESQAETFGEMRIVLALSLLSIFLILLLQFRSVRQSLVIMASVPLALPGAMAGLFVTRNPFSFTAFMGVISLSGVVVRNAIILVDYINERRAAGADLETAAREAGERRLRPIFLTTAAAAVGVTPLILSGSSLWSPLASAIAVGLLFSMFFTLLLVPVLYVFAERRTRLSLTLAGLAALSLLAPASQAQVRRMTLDEALELASRQNPLVQLAQLKVKEAQARQTTARANYFPQVASEGLLTRLSSEQRIELPRGSLGVFPSLGPLPQQDLTVLQGLNALQLVRTSVNQPLTQWIRIRAGERVAAQDVKIAGEELRKARNEVALKVREAFYGLLLYRARIAAAERAAEAAETLLKEGRDAVDTGAALELKALEAEALALQKRNTALAARLALDDLEKDFNQLLGLPLDSRIDPEPPALQQTAQDLDHYKARALESNPEIRAASETVEKARQAVSAARADYIPELGVSFQHVYQNGVPFLPRSNAAVIGQLQWNIFDWGKRGGHLAERRAQLEQAEVNRRRLETHTAAEVEKAWSKVRRLEDLAAVASKLVEARREARRIAADQVELGLANLSVLKQAEAQLAEAEAQLLEARLGASLAVAELERIAGLPH
ncbi:MAG: efflux RND transporter permease subunit [Bryobacteraceae bacterium]